MKTKLTHLREILLYQNAGLRTATSAEAAPFQSQSEPPEFNGLRKTSRLAGDHEFLDLLELKLKLNELEQSGS